LQVPGACDYSSQVAKRVCYIHIGPHKSGTTSIQWFLKENRAELLKDGYLVPESEDFRGGHYQLVTQLCGRAVPQHQREAAARVRQRRSKMRNAKQLLFLRKL
jgi:hypothetical protein